MTVCYRLIDAVGYLGFEVVDHEVDIGAGCLGNVGE